MHPVGKTICWIEKWMTRFMMGTTSSITMQNLGKIVQRAPAVGAKMLCLFFCFWFFYRHDAAKRQTAGIVFTHRPKIRFFRPAGETRCTDSGQTLQDRRALGSAWLCKISPQSPQGVGMRPQKYQKFPLFGDSLD